MPPALERQEDSVEAHGHDGDEGAWPSRSVGPGVVCVKSGNNRLNVISGRITLRYAFAPCRLNCCSRCLMPPDQQRQPTMPLRMIIMTANSVSRVSVGLFSPCSMTAVIAHDLDDGDW